MFRAVAGSASLLAVGLVIVLTAPPTSGCGSSTSCTAANFGFSNVIVPRALFSLSSRPCTQPDLHVIASYDEYKALWAALPDAGSDPPSVDFSSERVIVRTQAPDLGVAWAALDGTTLALGLQRCATSTVPLDCTTELLMVQSPVVDVTSRTCDSVACGNPVIPVANGH